LSPESPAPTGRAFLLRGGGSLWRKQWVSFSTFFRINGYVEYRLNSFHFTVESLAGQMRIFVRNFSFTRILT
jgi:hypothetical protein